MNLRLTISFVSMCGLVAVTHGAVSSPAFAADPPRSAPTATPTGKSAPSPAPTARFAPAPTVTAVPRPTVLKNPCVDLPTPNRTYKLRGVGAELFSSGTLGSDGCSGFVADIHIDADSKADDTQYFQEIQFDSRDTVREYFHDHAKDNGNHAKVAKISEAECIAHKHSFQVFKKAAGESAFTPFGGGALVATWNAQGIGWGPICMINPGPSFKAIPKVLPPTQGTDVYRLIVTVANPPGQLSAWVQHPRK